MDAPVGRIVSVGAGHATVTVDAAAVCPRCASGKGCGAGLFAGPPRVRLIEVTLSPGMVVKVGDEVKLTLAPSQLLRAAFLGYGLPLLTVVIALGVAWFSGYAVHDAAAAFFALCGLIVGMLLGRRFLNREACFRDFVPSVSERNA